MGVGISMANLAAAVANCGGVGVISGWKPDFIVLAMFVTNGRLI